MLPRPKVRHWSGRVDRRPFISPPFSGSSSSCANRLSAGDHQEQVHAGEGSPPPSPVGSFLALAILRRGAGGRSCFSYWHCKRERRDADGVALLRSVRQIGGGGGEREQLSRLGSRPPRCERKCGGCAPAPRRAGSGRSAPTTSPSAGSAGAAPPSSIRDLLTSRGRNLQNCSH